MTFLTPFLPYIALYLCFASQMVLLVFYHDYSLFTSPVASIHTGACNRHCERESACGGGKQDNRSTIIFGSIRVLTPTAFVAGECWSNDLKIRVHTCLLSSKRENKAENRPEGCHFQQKMYLHHC